ncbi:unnamed protein product, partial [Scytosiphon promiscuus]
EVAVVVLATTGAGDAGSGSSAGAGGDLSSDAGMAGAFCSAQPEEGGGGDDPWRVGRRTHVRPLFRYRAPPPPFPPLPGSRKATPIGGTGAKRGRKKKKQKRKGFPLAGEG